MSLLISNIWLLCVKVLFLILNSWFFILLLSCFKNSLCILGYQSLWHVYFSDIFSQFVTYLFFTHLMAFSDRTEILLYQSQVYQFWLCDLSILFVDSDVVSKGCHQPGHPDFLLQYGIILCFTFRIDSFWS